MSKQLSKDVLRQIKTMWLHGQNWRMTADEMQSLIELVKNIQAPAMIRLQELFPPSMLNLSNVTTKKANNTIQFVFKFCQIVSSYGIIKLDLS